MKTFSRSLEGFGKKTTPALLGIHNFGAIAFDSIDHLE